MTRWGWFCLLALVLPGGAVARQARPQVVVLKSAALAPYAAVVAGFRAEVNAEVVEVMLEDSAPAAARTFQRIAAQKPALVLAIGPLAANTARRAPGSGVPVLFARVPYYGWPIASSMRKSIPERWRSRSPRDSIWLSISPPPASWTAPGTWCWSCSGSRRSETFP